MIFGREPNLWINALAAVLAVLVGFNTPGLTDGQAAAITALVTAVAAAITAFKVRPVAPAVFSGVVATGATLLSAYGFDLAPTHVGLISAGVVALMALVTRAQVTPASDPRPGVGATSRG